MGTPSSHSDFRKSRYRTELHVGKKTRLFKQLYYLQVLNNTNLTSVQIYEAGTLA